MQKNQHNLFVILLGVSAVGKSSLIREILKSTNDYVYVKPYMTRPLRIDETDKISVSNNEFESMQRNGDFLVVNQHYGFKYGTPKTTIVNILKAGKIPILDYQLSSIENLYDSAYTLLKIYIQPESKEAWESRLKRSEQFDEVRFAHGKSELEYISQGSIENVDVIITNKDDEIEHTAKEILKIINSRL